MTAAQLHEGARQTQRSVERSAGGDEHGAIGDAGDTDRNPSLRSRFDADVGFDLGER